MKKQKHFLMILAGAALLSMVAVEADAKPKDGKIKPAAAAAALSGDENKPAGSKKETSSVVNDKKKTSATTEPTATEPITTPEPTATEPTMPEPPKPEPTATEPTATEPTATEPTATEPTATDPPKPEPTVTEPPTRKPPTRKPTTTKTTLKPASKPAENQDAANDEVKKPLTLSVVDWILVSLGAAGVILAAVLLVYVIILRKGMREMDQRALEHAAKSGNLEKAFGDKLKLAISSAVAEAVREKNPILNDYDELREQAYAAQQALESCQNDLNASRSACDEAGSEVTRLTAELDTVNGNLDTLQQNFDACSKDLADERAKSESLQGTVEKYETIIGKNVLEMAQEINENDPSDRSVLMGLAKMNAMHDANVDARNILREFQSFDVQLNMIIRDQEMLQAIREGIKPFVEGLLNNEYRISWPKIGANISEYNQAEELDLDESESGTTIKVVKCATIRFADADGATFQKAKVICD